MACHAVRQALTKYKVLYAWGERLTRGKFWVQCDEVMPVLSVSEAARWFHRLPGDPRALERGPTPRGLRGKFSRLTLPYNVKASSRIWPLHELSLGFRLTVTTSSAQLRSPFKHNALVVDEARAKGLALDETMLKH